MFGDNLFWPKGRLTECLGMQNCFWQQSNAQFNLFSSFTHKKVKKEIAISQADQATDERTVIRPGICS
jgi:hypothetical protein